MEDFLRLYHGWGNRVGTTERVIDPEWENFFAGGKARSAGSVERELSGISVFSLLKPRDLHQLARLVHPRSYERGETIIRAGVTPSGFYMILSGSVDIVRERLDHSRRIVATLHPPELIGEFALLDDSPRSTSVVAAEPSELIGFFRPDLLDIITTMPEMGCMILVRLAKDMTHRLREDYALLREMGYPFPDRDGDGDGLDPTVA